MPRSYESIEGDISQAREALASTLDEIIDRVSPKNLAEEGKNRAAAALKDPKVLAILGGVTALVVAGAVGVTVSKRKQRSRIEAYLASKK